VSTPSPTASSRATQPRVAVAPAVVFALLFVGSVAAVWAPTAPATAGPAAEPANAGDTAWMLTATALVLLMTPGLSFFYGGMVRAKNVISTMLQSFISMGVVSLIWVTVGFSLAFGDSIGGVVGNPGTHFMFRGVGDAPSAALCPTVPLALFALYQMKFAIITPALVSGSFAERVRFSSYLVFISLFTVFVYCPLAHATWHPNGVLHRFGVLDFAGGTVVHMSAGLAALTGAIFLGRRAGHGPGRAHVPAHIPFVLLGTGMLWFGWFGFNAGSALSASPLAVHAFVTTNTASAAAMLSWICLERLQGRPASALGACIGAVVGLVAITPAAGFVSVGASLCIGVIASAVSTFAVRWKSQSNLDDTLDVFPCHGVGGMVGMIATGLFASKAVNPAGEDGLVFGGTTLFLKHLAALVAVSAFTSLGAWILYVVTDKIRPLRVLPEEEKLGLDITQHGESLLNDGRSSMVPEA
jgi:ammonium transporter, Amt family